MKLDIYLVTDDKFFKGRDLVNTIEKALKGGITAIQYRFKDKSTRQMYEELLVLRELTKEYNADLVVNDRVDLAIAVGADGVHVGQEDLPPDVVKSIIPKNMYIGYSINSVDILRESLHLSIDYIGFGSIFETSTKKNYKLVGLQGLAQAVKLSNKPIIAIGGINHYNLEKVIDAGAKGIAVVSSILGFEDVEKAALELKNAYKDAIKKKLLIK